MVMIVGIAGGSASGKTTILRELEEDLGEQAKILAMDAYYKPYSEYSLEERIHLNYDHPDAFDVERLLRDLKALKRGEAIEMPIYDYTQYTRSDRVQYVAPHPLILLEGLFVLYYQELLPLLDLKVYVQADADVRLVRRIYRDRLERQRSLESILTQYIDTVKPMHEAFISPTKKNADLILPRGAENRAGIDILREHLRGQIKNIKKM